MALKILTNGQYVIKTRKQAVEALEMMQTLKNEIAELRKEHGLDELEQDAVELKKAATRWMTEHDETHLQADGFHGTLVAGFDKRWILTDDDLQAAGQPVGARSLRRVLKKKFSPEEFKRIWASITKRVVNPEGIEELVTDGILDMDDLAQSLVEKPRAPYLRIYED